LGGPAQVAPETSGPAAIQLPLPSALRGVSYTQQDLRHWGKEYSDALPNGQVSRDSLEAVFTPHWVTPGAKFTDLAYATFQFQLSGFDLSPIVRFTWSKPGSFTDGWVALANFQRDRWEWFQLPESGELAFDPATGLSGAGAMYVVVLLTGEAEWRMREISVGLDEHPGDWSMFGHDARHTHSSTFTGPAANTLKWSYSTSTSVSSSSPAIAADGTVYIGNNNGAFYAINPDGSLKWSRSDAYGYGWIRSSPAIAPDGTIYVGICFIYMDEFGYFYNCAYLLAYNRDGSVAWCYSSAGFMSSSPVIATDGTVYAVTDQEPTLGYPPLLQALKPDGSLLWSYAMGGAGDPALGADGTVYVGSDKLYAINSDGSLQWSYTTGSAVSSPAIDADGTVYVGSDKLYAINPDGSLKWSSATGSAAHAPGICGDGTVYVGSDKLYAINPDGSLKWSFATGGGVDSSPAIDAAGTIYVGCNDNKLYAIDANGNLKWSYATGREVVSSPAIGADGSVFFGSNDSKLYAIGPGDG
jgi:outer membrane protein assembly factor BamB